MTLVVILPTGEVHAIGCGKRCLERVKNLIIRNGNGNWAKLICGASFEVLFQKSFSDPIVG